MTSCLAEALVAADPSKRVDTSEPAGGTIRSAAHRLGRRIALDIDPYWERASEAPDGPVDLVDFFSGCGGMSAGFKAVNGALPVFRHIAAVDIDGVANRSYETNIGIPPERVSVADLAADPSLLKALMKRSGRREGHPLVLIGCAPCQGFSSHRNAAGAEDTRNTLFSDFIEVAIQLQPDALIVENVPELLTERYWPFVADARERLSQHGYDAHVGIYNMAGFGVPQERFRAVMLALPKPFEPPTPFLARSEYRTVRDAIERLPAVDAGERVPADELHYSAGHNTNTLDIIRAVPKDGGNRPSDMGPACLTRVRQRQGRSAYDDVYGRLWWDRPSITVTAYARNPASGRFIHPEQDRALTVREAALLQGFPTRYWLGGTLDQRFRQVGNAVPPVFASYLACHLLGEILGGSVEATPKGVTSPVGTSFSRLIPALKAGHVPKELAAHRALALCA